MKLNKTLLLFVVTALFLVACGDNGENANEDTNVGNIDLGEENNINEVGNDAGKNENEPGDVADASNEIVLGQPLEIGDYTMTIQDYSIAQDYEGKDALVVTYDWVNNADSSNTPFMTFSLKAFQDGVETTDVFMVDGVDLGIGQKEVRPGGQIEGAQAVVGIDDLSKPLELELDELLSFEDNAYIAIIDLSAIE